MDVIESDVLKVDFTQVAQTLGVAKVRVVGNLPYNISTPILFHLLEQVHVIEDQHFMLQKEVIDRMVARPSTGDYGRLSVMLQWRYAMEDVLFVPPESFDPPPRVDSAVVRMVPHAAPPAVSPALLSELWCRWPSANAASCCGTRSAAGWKHVPFLGPSIPSAGPKKCRCTNTWPWHSHCTLPERRRCNARAAHPDNGRPPCTERFKHGRHRPGAAPTLHTAWDQAAASQ